MTVTRLLIANRGEIAVRIAQTAAEMGVETVAVFGPEDAAALHPRRADRAVALPGRGARAYLDPAALVAAAVEAGADAVHPGYGFLSESAEFARACEAAGLTWVGPTPDALALFGDKLAAKALARKLDVPVIPGSDGPVDAAGALAVFDTLPEGAAMVIKAAAGGGGRGMRVVTAREEVEAAHARCTSEAKAAFGDGSVYAERFLPEARHLEVQVIGDGTGACLHLHERDCTLQRRHQKVIEIAPAPTLTDAQRARLTGYALTLAGGADYRSLGTFEFLAGPDGEEIFFIEANPRIQVEHTVTEEVLGLDLVRLQLEIAGGATLAGLGLTQEAVPAPSGFAVQARVNMERMAPDGTARPATGTLTRWEPPTGRGIRVDAAGFAGWTASTAFDSLLAKVIVHAPHGGIDAALAKTDRALAAFGIEGIATNRDWLRALLRRPETAAGTLHTRFIEAEAAALAAEAAALAPAPEDGGAGAGQAEAAAPEPAAAPLPAGAVAAAAPLTSTVVSVEVAPGDRVRRGQAVAVLEAMKMEHVVAAPCAGEVVAIPAAPGQTLQEGAALVAILPEDGGSEEAQAAAAIDLDRIRPDLQELARLTGFGLDENRPEAVRKRHARGQRTARENLAAVCDEGTFQEYGALAIAAQAARRTREDLTLNTTGDGVVTGLGTVNGDLFAPDRARTAFAICDYMVLAGTQGQRHHRKLDRIFSVAKREKMPLVLFAEGGGGRPGDTERTSISGLISSTFATFAGLSGQAPLVGVVSGRCFAGNAALLGCCDVIIADESSNIGMAGPAMIEGGGLGVFSPEEVGPIDLQSKNGVVDLRVKDEAEAAEAARRYLSYFQGDLETFEHADQRLLREAIPENRLRVHDIRGLIETLCDKGSVLELRREFGLALVTCLVRIGGKAFGLIANDCRHLSGAIDAPAADKAARFLQLCDTFGLPIVSLCDTPGFMVGPEAEKTALVRHVCRMFVAAASLSTPMFSVVVRKGYGLGAMAMTGGAFHESLFTVSWPTGEYGGMGLEGGVRLGYRKEFDALETPEEKQALYEELVAKAYEIGKATSVATTAEIDAVIDPATTRDWILAGLRSCAPRAPGARATRSFIDPW
ncbi:MAG: carboxyl transferase domain-containing protein [Pseudomonadota bacterium]|nr:carboxyl transferase domain-containing protein [Pseudomonadota bacterium]